ncbi:hypothetical protein FNH04_31885, partial [Streptomyces phyllanthi]|nr:hypothetical protein [Streptomyces phyllanthi]
MTPNRHRARVLRAEAAAAVLAGFLLAAGGAPPASASPFPDGVRAGAPMDAGDPVKYYIVGKERDGKPEFLYSIAEKVLGDGSRFGEIFELNKNRVQADGGVLTQPTAIEAGWVLQLPADAKGEGVRVGELPTSGSASPPPSPRATATPQPQAVDSPPGAADSNGLAPVLGAGAAALLLGAMGGYALQRRRTASRATSGIAPAAAVTSVSGTAPATAAVPPGARTEVLSGRDSARERRSRTGRQQPAGRGARRADESAPPVAAQRPEPAADGASGVDSPAGREGRTGPSTEVVTLTAPAAILTAQAPILTSPTATATATASLTPTATATAAASPTPAQT